MSEDYFQLSKERMFVRAPAAALALILKFLLPTVLSEQKGLQNQRMANVLKFAAATEAMSLTALAAGAASGRPEVMITGGQAYLASRLVALTAEFVAKKRPNG